MTKSSCTNLLTSAVGELSSIVMTMTGHATCQPIAVLESGSVNWRLKLTKLGAMILEELSKN